MNDIVFATLVLLFVAEGASIDLDTENLFQECISYTDDIWDIYRNHFLLVDHLTIHVLQTDKYTLEVNEYTDKFLKILSRYDYSVALEIKDTFLKNTRFNEEKSGFTFTEPFVNFRQKFEPIDYDELLRIKRLSSNSLKGYFIIIWDVESLHFILDEDFRLVIPEERATYALQFVFTSTEYCDTIRNDISNILRRFWLEYNVINVVAQTPCCCDRAQIYIYRPFIKINESWGITQTYSFTEIMDNFRTITNPLDNFNRFPLNVNIIIKPPTAVRDLPKLLKLSPIYKNLSFSKGFGGVDGLILGTLSEYLNFNVNLVGSTSTNYFGSRLANGTITPGAMKDMIERKIVYGANARYLMNYDDLNIEFTVPHTAEYSCVIVPKALKIPIWTSLFRCFNKFTWLTIIVTCTTSTVFWYYFGPTRIFQKVAWTMFSYLCGISERIEPNVQEFIFLSACMLFNIVILGIIQGSMFRTFSIATYYPDIKTLEELDKSEFPLCSSIWSYIQDNTPVLQNLKKKSLPRVRNAYQLMTVYRNFSTTESKSNLDFTIRTHYLDDDGSPLLYIVNECLGTFLMAHMVPKGSAFKTVFNYVITKVVEAGLTKKWNKDIVDSLVVEKMTSLNKNRETVRAFSLYDLQIAFYVIVLGYVSSSLLFVYEIFSNRKQCLQFLYPSPICKCI